MKSGYLAWIVLMVLVLISCPLIKRPWDEFDYWFRHDEVLGDVADVLDWTSKEIIYPSFVPEVIEYYNSPKEVYESRIDMCMGFCTIAAYFCWSDLGYDDVYIVFLENEDGAGHAIIKVGGEYYEPQIGSYQMGFDVLEMLRDLGYSVDEEMNIKEALYKIVNTHMLYSSFQNKEFSVVSGENERLIRTLRDSISNPVLDGLNIFETGGYP